MRVALNGSKSVNHASLLGFDVTVFFASFSGLSFFFFTFPSFLTVISKDIDLNKEKRVNKYKEIFFWSQIKGFSYVAGVCYDVTRSLISSYVRLHAMVNGIYHG